MEMQIGGFLDRLEIDFGLINRVKPIFAKPNSRSVKYQIHDNFLNFWFRFIYKYRGAIEIGNLKYVKDIVIRDYTVFSGRVLEKYFANKLKIDGNYSAIGTYWEKGNKNEIDIVAIIEINKVMVIVEVKRKADNINMDLLIRKSDKLTNQFNDFAIEYKGLSMDDM